MELTTRLYENKIEHAYIGGYATSLLDQLRTTDDIDVIVDSSPQKTQELLMAERKSTCACHLRPPVNIMRLEGRLNISTKLETDLTGIKTQLKWITDRGMHIDSAGYPERPKTLSLDNVSGLYKNVESEQNDIRELLEQALEPHDLAAVLALVASSQA
ncbi:hypothetical protein UA08_04873 [Talaromyces atroroseus]|uniref:Uncharacterized protein n=1 Tax=Talaromyces atroroseus TaxID=1441469 RepID=A0A225AW96_TALAT|nr:hypothetical protein UA08_04873 [Talaromyces atroroseus]OKL59889.1 hypothetical protein UA08_04873 [Talaromyces atroroseus]